MTPAEINRAIAESMGWVLMPHEDLDMNMVLKGGRIWYRHPVEKTVSSVHNMPDYYNDLNACVEFEEAVCKHDSEQDVYVNYLYIRMASGNRHPVRATAPQRCEAYLRTIGKWREQ
jgi:hypothetical protein